MEPVARLWASEAAIDRFRERWCPGFTFSHAKRELLTIAAEARRTDSRAPDGHEIWRAGTNGEVRLVIARDGGTRFAPTIVTVLGPE